MTTPSINVGGDRTLWTATELNLLRDGVAELQGIASGGSYSSAHYDPDLQWLGATIKRALVAQASSFGIGFLGDSKGNDSPSGPLTGDWPYELGKLIAAAYPAWTVNWYIFGDGNQFYNAPVTIQTGTGGARGATFVNASSHTLFLPSGDIAPTSGDLDVAAHILPDTWSPTTAYVYVAHNGAAGVRGFYLGSTGGGSKTLTLTWSNDGTTLLTAQSNANLPFANGTDGWIRATLDVNDGASNRVARFYTSTDGSTWTQLGTAVTVAAVTTVNVPNTPWEIGGRGTNGTVMNGTFYEARICDSVVSGTTATGVNALNSATVNVGATASFPTTGAFMLTGTYVTYTGVTATSFTGCSSHPATTGGEVITGPTGKPLCPAFPDAWEPTDTNSPAVTGAPILALIVGCVPGVGLSYLADSTRLPKLLPDYTLRAIFTCTSTNDNLQEDATYVASWNSWLTAIKTRCIQGVPVVVTQNPEYAPAVNLVTYNMRRNIQLALALEFPAPTLDAYQAFLDTGSPSSYVNASDGTHPTLTVGPNGYSGAQVWANDAYLALFHGV